MLVTRKLWELSIFTILGVCVPSSVIIIIECDNRFIGWIGLSAVVTFVITSMILEFKEKRSET